MTYEKFTDRAGKVMQLAEQEAQRLGHDSINPEHVLLGLIKEDSGVAAAVLKNFDINLRDTRLGVLRYIAFKPEHNRGLGQTNETKKIIEYSIEESRKLNHNYTGTEHLLLALLKRGDEEDSTLSKVFYDLKLKPDNVRNEILNLLGFGEENPKTKQSVQPKYWQVPRQRMNLEGFLKTSGYNIKFEAEVENKRTFQIYRENLGLGTLSSTIGTVNIRIAINYNTRNPSQIEESLNLADLLQKNEVPYSETPSRKELANELRKPVEQTATLLERLEASERLTD